MANFADQKAAERQLQNFRQAVQGLMEVNKKFGQAAAPTVKQIGPVQPKR